MTHDPSHDAQSANGWRWLPERRDRPRIPIRRWIRGGIWLSLCRRYGRMPVWVLLAQAFLALGWLRAAVAHGLSPDWRSGAEVERFRLEHQEAAVGWYRQSILDEVVGPAPDIIAGVVLAAQMLVAAMLLLQIRPLIALALGAFMNLNFALAGAVDPSVFYLVIAAAIAMWHIETAIPTSVVWWISLPSTIVAFTLVGSLAPAIATLDPDEVTHDPALVLTLISMLWVLSVWLILGRRLVALSRADQEPVRFDPDRADATIEQSDSIALEPFLDLARLGLLPGSSEAGADKHLDESAEPRADVESLRFRLATGPRVSNP